MQLQPLMLSPEDIYWLGWAGLGRAGRFIVQTETIHDWMALSVGDRVNGMFRRHA